MKMIQKGCTILRFEILISQELIYFFISFQKHIRRAHPDQEIISLSNEINNNSDQIDSASDKPTNQYHLSNENPTLTDESDTQNATTPPTITIAEMDTDDVPIRFRVCSL